MWVHCNWNLLSSNSKGASTHLKSTDMKIPFHYELLGIKKENKFAEILGTFLYA